MITRREEGIGAERVREQVQSGSLVIRRMTAEERRRYPPVAPQPKPIGRR